MNLELPVAAAKLAGELVPPKDVDQNLLETLVRHDSQVVRQEMV